MASSSPPKPLRRLGNPRAWGLDASWAFLNFGSFGARPLAVTRAASRWRQQFERHPIRFLDDPFLWDRLDTALQQVSKFLGADRDGLVFVPNVTDAVAAVLQSVSWRRGDAILTTSHAYGAVRRAIEATCAAHGTKAVVASVPCPVESDAQIEAIVLAAVTKRTRLAIIDQVTSPTGLRLPVERLSRALRRRGIEVLVDAAHSAGMLPRPVTTSATWWTSNLHKWGFAPVGCAVLWTRPSRRATTRPTAISHMHFKGYQQAFSWQGTRDVTAWLTAPDAIDWVRQREGWTALRAHNARLARWAGDQLTQGWDTETAGPLAVRKGVSMVTVRLPETARTWRDPLRLRDALADRHRVEVALWNEGPQWWVRVATQAFVRTAHIDRLLEGIEDLVE